MDSDSSPKFSLSASSKKIKKKHQRPQIIVTPTNESEAVSHFKPSTSSDLIFGRFFLVKHIADGTFGRVFEAKDKLSGKSYALKVF